MQERVKRALPKGMQVTQKGILALPREAEALQRELLPPKRARNLPKWMQPFHN
jgi:hypothetical protein